MGQARNKFMFSGSDNGILSSQVFWMAWPTNMDKNIFQDPEKFDPARFEDQSKLLPPFTYILFGAGPRVCLGSEFARVGVLLLIRHLITKASLLLCYRTSRPVPFQGGDPKLPTGTETGPDLGVDPSPDAEAWPVFKTSLMGSDAVFLTCQAGNKFLFSRSDSGISTTQVTTAKDILGSHSIFELSGSRRRLLRDLTPTWEFEGKGFGADCALNEEDHLQEQMRALEAREGRKGDKNLITWREVQMIKYTWRVAQEVMTINPPVFGNFKCACRDTTFQGFDIHKGWQLSIHSLLPIDTSPIISFRPSKLLPRYTYIPFGAGPWICLGAEFARIEVLLLLHHLITRYEWTEMVPGEPICQNPMPTQAMGLHVKLHPVDLMENWSRVANKYL
ncbi:hypothetical protein CDL15_Pgr025722 [Punica granatum]|uniref:Uncharacterized protein n=1 Tax=Punica granatum TaxID=22663 RepID=A0A218WBF5_PUNGR|nr:hypothetical protein CDL15_Pgr025722 [Punica granatum]